MVNIECLFPRDLVKLTLLLSLLSEKRFGWLTLQQTDPKVVLGEHVANAGGISDQGCTCGRTPRCKVVLP